MPTDRATVPHSTSGLRWPAEPAQGGWYSAAEHRAIARLLTASQDWRVGFKPAEYVARFEASFAHYTGTEHAVAFNSGGTAMEMVLRHLTLEPGDEVISCAMQFVGPHLAVINQGGRLVLAEPDPVSLNLDPVDTERVMSTRTRAIIVTHWNGAVADLRPFLDLAARHPHPVHGPPVVIVDAARACGGRTAAGTRVGADGAWATVFSFESKKLMTTLGQGGMVTTGDPELADRLRWLRTYGGTQHWGTNQLMTKAQAAVGLVQLERLDAMNQARITVAHERGRVLADVPELTLPPLLDDGQHLYYRHNLLVPDAWAGEGRDRLMEVLAVRYGVGSIISDRPAYQFHRHVAEHVGAARCPRADRLAARLLCPCLHPQMSPAEQAEISDAIRGATAEVARTFTPTC
ncbi:DegT/DnrJ/EryC1/StrS family aminotransferase [Streptomyces sp. NPDC001691]|uniref:DegT/DnrJ/EryC1/StrS family aminotransferase n=1 Tax=Streptomyces sp. NPDC001691 TaxID=3364600 RepID=UPI00367CDD1A